MLSQKKIDGEIFQRTLEILRNLINFKTLSGKSNLELIDYCEKELKKSGAISFKTFNKSKTQANLFSTISGKKDSKNNGIILSGHTDVVPAIESEWTSNAY